MKPIPGTLQEEALRTEVASTVSDPADVDQELYYLYQILTA